MGDSQFHQLTKMVEFTTSTLVYSILWEKGIQTQLTSYRSHQTTGFTTSFFNKKWAKPAFFSESKCRTNGKSYGINLHKFEPPQIMQPSFTFLTALLHTLHLLYFGSNFHLHSQLCQFHRQFKGSSSRLSSETIQLTPSTTQKTTERMECNMSNTES